MSNGIIPVLVVGAGPAGLVAALTLRRNGIPVRIIEKEEKIRDVGQRGVSIQPRSQEVYNLLGVLDDIGAKSSGMDPMRIYKLPGGTEPLVTFDIDPYMVPTHSRPYSNVMLLAQTRQEGVVRDHLARTGCEVELGMALTGIQEKADHIEAYITKTVGGEEIAETIRCRWLVGTDGGRSVVRKQLNLAFEGQSFADPLVIGDLEIKGIQGNYWHFWGDMSTVMVILRSTGEKDIYTMMLGGQVDFDKAAADRDELERMIRIGTGRADLQVGHIRLLFTFRPQARMAEVFRKGRVLIAGDAAHVHTPFGGQGLNTSIQDAINLGWKLSLVAKGVAAPSLLDSYNDERPPIIAEMLKLSSTLFNNFVQAKSGGKDRENAWKRGGDLHQFGVNYRWSPIVLDQRTQKEDKPVDPYGHTRSPAGIVRAGERAPDASGLVILAAKGGFNPAHPTTSLFKLFDASHHTVLLFSDGSNKVSQVVKALQAYPTDLLKTVLVRTETSPPLSAPDGIDWSVLDRDGHAHAGYHAEKHEFLVVVVRPDGSIGGILRGADGTKRYFDGVFSAIAK